MLRKKKRKKLFTTFHQFVFTLSLIQIDKDTDLRYSLSTDAELISIKSLTLGKVTGEALRGMNGTFFSKCVFEMMKRVTGWAALKVVFFNSLFLSTTTTQAHTHKENQM